MELRFGRGELSSGTGGLEGSLPGGGDLPSLGGDFDELAIGVGEIEEDLFGSVGRAASIDAAGDGDVEAAFVARGLGLEVMTEGVPGRGTGDGFKLGEGFAEEPFAKGAGTDGEGEVAGIGAGVGGDVDEGLALGGSEGAGAVGDGEELVEAGGAGGSGGAG